MWRNVDTYRNWLTFDRDTRVKASLWFAVPMLIAAILMQRARALYALATDRWPSDFRAAYAIVFLTLSITALALFWAGDMTWGPKQGDRIWCNLMRIGLATGAVTGVLSWWF